MALDATHDPARRSWVASAQAAGADFPIQNLPHGVFRRLGSGEPWRGGVAIGDQVLDLAAALRTGVFGHSVRVVAEAAAAPELNDLMAMGRPAWRALRAALSALLADGAREQPVLLSCLVPQAECEHRLPARVGDCTDFFTSHDHMVHMGRLFQPDRPLLPQFHWLPIAYHGRTSTLEVSGAALPRPWGQRRPPGQAEPVFAPTAMLDHELELAAWVGPGNRRGRPIPVDEAEDHLFGLSLFNDWSARDLQGWESLPLGPFLSKNFLGTLSPWIVTWEALAPFRGPVRRDADWPQPLPHLRPRAGLADAGLDLQLEVELRPAGAHDAVCISRCNAGQMAWSFGQMLAHHTSNGCALRPGDLLGSGTISGPGEGEQGCLMELTQGGRQPLQLPGGACRVQWEDGDTVVLRARAERAGAASIGFGPCAGQVSAALD